jgi:hypothetical protein
MSNDLGGLDFKIASSPMEELDTLSRIELGFPHDFLEYEEVRSTVYGNTFTLIDNHRN